MLFTKLFFVLAVAIVFRQTDAQCIGRIRTVVPAYPQPTVVPTYPQSALVPGYPQPPCCSSYKNDDLGTALLLAQLLNEKDGNSKQPSTPVYASGNLNVEDIIMKLVNALIYTTTQSGKTTGTGSTGSGGSGNLVDLDLLGNNGNLLGLGLGGQGVLGVGVGQ